MDLAVAIKKEFSNQSTEKTNLIINYLPLVNDSELIDIFKAAGEIQSVRIMKNFDGTSKGYGFVKFKTQKEAERAIEMFNGLVIHEKKLKVTFSQPANTNLFVTHLPASWTSESLLECFQDIGEVVEARVLERDGQSRLCGFVRFGKPEDALLAIERVNGWKPPNASRGLQIILAKKHQKYKKSPHSNSNRYNRRTSSHQRYYSDPRYNDYSQTHYFPEMNHHNYNYAYPGFHQYQEHSPQCEISSLPDSHNKGSFPIPQQNDSQTKPQSTIRSKQIFLYNLPQLFDEDDLMSFCETYGSVENVVIQKDNQGASLGMGFVTFSYKKDTEKAIDGLSGINILGRCVQAKMIAQK